jgi:hypothetical protein
MTEHPNLAIMRGTLAAFKRAISPSLRGSSRRTWCGACPERARWKKLDVRLLLHVTIRGGQIVEGTDCIHHEHSWDAFWS